METNNISIILQAIISLAVIGISAFLIPWLREKLGNETFNKIQSWVEAAVSAAEQLAKAKALSPEERKTFVKEFMAKKGFNLEDADLDNLIEAAVYTLNNMKSDLDKTE